MSFDFEMNDSSVDQLRRDAWIGDAVLLLFARKYVLETGGLLDDARCTRLTSNHFLNRLGNPTKVEAAIGRTYKHQGMEAAMQWIQDQLVPAFEKQELNRRKRAPKKVRGEQR
jgi:dsRNA-specific ribonuclease